MGASVLIVEGDPEGRERLGRDLASHGYCPVVAISLEQAFAEVLATWSPDVILLAAEPAHGAARAALGRLRSDTRLAQIPVLLLIDGSDLPEHIMQGDASGATYCLARPCETDQLIRALRIIAPGADTAQRRDPDTAGDSHPKKRRYEKPRLTELAPEEVAARRLPELFARVIRKDRT